MTQTLTIPEAAKVLNVSDKTIRRWIDTGRLTAEKVDRKWSVHVDLDIDLDIDSDKDKAYVPVPIGSGVQPLTNGKNFFGQALNPRTPQDTS